MVSSVECEILAMQSWKLTWLRLYMQDRYLSTFLKIKSFYHQALVLRGSYHHSTSVKSSTQKKEVMKSSMKPLLTIFVSMTLNANVKTKPKTSLLT